MLQLQRVNSSGGYELSSCLADLDGQQYLFHIWLTPYNFTPRNRTFTVSAISDDIVPKPHSEVGYMSYEYIVTRVQ
ncbi:hypothetical protein Bca4012_064003 [Brassica carinata]|uniref:Uncharacterized protein n=1 Tax=Brassica carinata TaxID=52824 RepID=A0A8X7SHY2_BRACI|nr:hypothetical protein Bca52824_027132 [Brassica carinata]